MELLKRASDELKVNYTQEMEAAFLKYRQLLLEWNEKMNLTAITFPDEILLKHFADSLTVAVALEIPLGARLIDVGTGAGFPGMPVKIARNDISLTLLDSLNKRVIFLEKVIAELGLTDVQAVHGRAEELAHLPPHRETYDISCSRAVARLSVLAEYCMPFVKLGGKFVSMKGPDVKSEILEAKEAIFRLGGEITEVKQVKIPFTDILHSLIIVGKIRHTNVLYPRKAAKIAKSPIN